MAVARASLHFALVRRGHPPGTSIAWVVVDGPHDVVGVYAMPETELRGATAALLARATRRGCSVVTLSERDEAGFAAASALWNRLQRTPTQAMSDLSVCYSQASRDAVLALTEATPMARVREVITRHRLPVSPGTGGSAKRTKRQVIQEMRTAAGVPIDLPAPPPMAQAIK